MVSLRTLALLYLANIRARPLPEILAVLGIAAGVALLFVVQVANKSVTGSFEQLTEGIAGRASLEIAARGPQGFDQELYKKVRRLPDVEIAAPVVERRVVVNGPNGRRALTLFGVDERLERLDGKLVTRIARDRDISDLGLYLTEPTAKAIGVAAGRTVTIKAGELTSRFPLAGVVLADEVGSLSQSPVAVAHLGLAQEVASMPGRISRILVAPVPGRESEAKAALTRVAAGTLSVRASSTEAKLLSEAASSDRQSTDLFSVISLIVGILLAYNAMLLTITTRRRIIASLHMLGASNKTIVASLVFEALILGVIGSLFGLLLGDLLSRYMMHQVPGYLSSAFAIGNQRVVGPGTIALSVAGGTLAAIAAAARPAIDLLRVGPLKSFSEKGQSAIEIRTSPVQKWLAWGGIALIALFTILSLLIPKTTLIGVVALVLGMALILPPLVTYLLTLAYRLARHTNSAAFRVAIAELVATPTRTTALAAVGALALFAILGITGPGQDLLRGSKQLHANVYSNADIWISPGGDENTYLSQPFNHEEVASRVRRLTEVESVRIGRTSFLDHDDRRLLVIGESRSTRNPIAPSQITNGDLDLATRRLRQGGWATLAQTLAEENNLKIGDEFTLPTPSGSRRFKLAATTTNYGWPSGAVMLNARDYGRAWKTQQASVLAVDLASNVLPAKGKMVIQEALGASTALKVRTADEGRIASGDATRQGLVRVNQIADMVLAAAVLAIVAAMLGSVWQRRQRMWGFISMGMGSGQLFRTIFYETGVILLLGCLIGAILGFFLQALGGRWLHLTTAYPVSFEPAFALALKTFILATALAVLAVAIPVLITFSSKRVIVASRD